MLKQMLLGLEHLSTVLKQYLDEDAGSQVWGERIGEGIQQAEAYNGWFTKESTIAALNNWAKALQKESLETFIEEQKITFANQPKTVALILAGNLPLVGFHDVLCTWLTGNKALVKLSSEDKILLPLLVSIIAEKYPEINDRISYSEQKLQGFDAVIATGSNNSARYFEYYFGKYPNIIRKNRTSVAVFTGDESPEEIERLGKDIFTHFGLGCRNVSHMLLPDGFQVNRFFEAILPFGDVVNHHKYQNNYDYQKAIYLMNRDAFLDNNFFMIKEDRGLFSPLGVCHYHFYTNTQEVESYLKEHEEQIQCVVGKGFIPFGEAQNPALSDFADGVNTVEFLKGL